MRKVQRRAELPNARRIGLPRRWRHDAGGARVDMLRDGQHAPTAPALTATLAGYGARLRDGAWRVVTRPAFAWWLVVVIALLALIPRLYGLNWDANNHLHPDERQIVFRAMCLGFPGSPRVGDCDPAYMGAGWFFSPASPLNPHFFAYGSFPLYLLAAVAHGLAWLSHLLGGWLLPSHGGMWDDFNHFTLIGRAISALFDAGSVLLAAALGRRLIGRWGGVLAAALVAVIPLDVQLAHFYTVDSLLLFFVLLTLLGCVRLAQATPAEDGWRLGLWIGVGFGLAMATKVSALPLIVPVGVAVALAMRRRGFDAVVRPVLGISAATVLAFVLTSPYALLDFATFRAQLDEQTLLSQGKLDYPYVRQFTETVPYLYQLQQMLLYNLGLPLGLLGLAGFGWAVARLWRSLNTEWAILVSWIAVYFVVVGRAYTKYPRYMLPIYAPLVLCGVGALAALAVWGARRLGRLNQERGQPRWRDPLASALARRATARWGVGWWRVACGVLAAGILAFTALAALAQVSIYSAPNTRVQASAWLYDHVPAGATLTYEVWDDPLPMLVPPVRPGGVGLGLTAAGHEINPGQYQQLGLNLYDSDTPEKAQQLAQALARANVVVISSRRLLDAIPRMPDRYPMSARYYQLLFSGQLGFTLVKHFDAQPQLGPLTFGDANGDESLSTFDHPPVWIFERSGAGLDAGQLETALTRDLALPPAYERMSSEHSLLLDAQAQQTNAQAQPLGVQFPAESLPNQIPVVWWLLFVELLGLFAFPLTYLAFPGLRDRGWGLAKLVGLLVLGWLVWMPASLGLLPFDHWIVVAMFALLGTLGAAVGWWRRAELRAFLRARWRLVVIGEAAFLVAFLFLTRIRSLDPDLWHFIHGGEKPMELAILDGVLRSRTMPPADAWFSGGYINYYYYGQYLIAVLIKLTGITPTTAFNLAIPLLFAVTFSAAFSLVAGLTRRWWAGLLGGVALVFVSNLDGLAQVIHQWQLTRAGQVPPAFDYWASSRVIPYTINEFPYWSFLFADLHAHVIDLPVVVLVIAACASLLASARAQAGRWRPAAPTLAVLALAVGGVWCISTWDLPLCVLLVGLGVLLRPLLGAPPAHWRAVPRWLSWPRVRAYMAALAVPLAGAYLLYLPFHTHFQNSVSGLGPVTTPTDPGQFVLLFGLWLFLTASFFFVELRDWWERAMRGPDGSTAGGATVRLWVLAGGYGLTLLLAYRLSVKALLLLLLVVGVALAWRARRSPVKLVTYLLLLLGLGIAFGVEVVYIRDFLDFPPWQRMNTVFKFYFEVWTCLSLGAALALAHLLPRLVPASVFAGATTGKANGKGKAREMAREMAPAAPRVAAVPALATVDATLDATVETRTERTPLIPSRVAGGHGVLRLAWLGLLLFLLAGSSIFLTQGTQGRVEEHLSWAMYQPPPGGIQPQLPSLDGMAYMRGWYPDDYAAITWMNQHIAGMPTIVEATNGPYQWYGRVSTYTGLPSVLGWSDHEAEQRYGQEVYPRQSDVQSFYAGEDPGAALTFLHQYDVRYVYIGELERTCYMTTGQDNHCLAMTPGALSKFETLEQNGALRVVYHRADTVIYQVVG